MTAFQSLLFILNARYSSFHMFFKPPSLIAAYNLKISDQAILGRTSTWTYTTIHTTYGSTDTRRCGFYFSLEMLQNSQDPIRFINWSSSRCVQSNDFRAPSGAACHRPAVHTYVNVVFYPPSAPATMAHTALHPLTPLFLFHFSPSIWRWDSHYRNCFLPTSLSFVHCCCCCSMMKQRGGDDDMTQISESSQLFPWSSLVLD